ncbi:hypothetical protein Acr_00g0072920 [Actinidia rufa]|uniref:Uncharacterized protein n=1 Tax=Actinidia rufa TaxID=165716 RepID=A0A7J0DTA5_9ERIC|nr:hypothetical protein Acr_00g0072920 [Actinidia rufa]
MFLGSHAPHVTDGEELHLGQIYFVMPISKSETPLSLQDLCALAIKASAALNSSVFQLVLDKTSGIGFPVGTQARCKVLDGFDMAGMGSQAVARGSRRIYLDQQS